MNGLKWAIFKNYMKSSGKKPTTDKDKTEMRTLTREQAESKASAFMETFHYHTTLSHRPYSQKSHLLEVVNTAGLVVASFEYRKEGDKAHGKTTTDVLATDPTRERGGDRCLCHLIPIDKPKPNWEQNKMEKMTQKEAFKAACEFVDERMGNESISIPVRHDPEVGVYSVDGWTPGSSREFAYEKAKPVPRYGTAVIDNGDGQVGYSMGATTKSKTLNVSECSVKMDCDTVFEDWEPVEIVRNGRHAKALALLKDCMNMLQFKDTAPRTVEQVREFLDDEPGKGGE